MTTQIPTASSAIDAILAQRAIPVVRAQSATKALQICTSLIAADLGVIELTATVPDWENVLRELRRTHPTATIGLGTVTSVDIARRAIDLEASFLVSPYPVHGLREGLEDTTVPLIGGGVTPGEIAEQSESGLCKLFPAHLGGTMYLKTLLAILPKARIMPTGGITVENAAEWIHAGAAAVGVGSDLYAAPDLETAIAKLRASLRTMQ